MSAHTRLRLKSEANSESPLKWTERLGFSPLKWTLAISLRFESQAGRKRSPLKWTERLVFSPLVGAGLANILCFLQIALQQNPPLL